MKETLYACDTCGQKIIRDVMVEILGAMHLPGNVSLSMAVHFHDDCLPPALHRWAQKALGNEE